MLRSRHPAALLMVCGALAAAPARAADDPRFVAGFADGLRARGYYDLALEYLDEARRSPDTPADVRESLDYREGRVLIEAASRDTDPDLARDRLDKAKARIEAFLKAHADRPEATDAQASLAKLLYERGRTEVNDAGEMKAPADRENRLAAARKFYGDARDAFGRAVDRLKEKLATYPQVLPRDDPRFEEREQVRGRMIDAELQREIVGFDEALTFPADSARRKELLEAARGAFKGLYDQYRTQMAGQTARMWEGKCFEEQGELGKAMGIYKELLDHPDPALRQLQRQIDYFRIVVMSKRKEYALAADESGKWLAMFPKDRRSYEALAVQTELARNILAQLPTLADGDKPKAVRAATDALADVARVASPFKPEALALLQKYRPAAAISAADAAKLLFDDALAEANSALSAEDFPRALTLLRLAGRKVDPSKEQAKANRARIVLGYALFKTGRYAEAAVVDEHIARNDPQGEWSAKAAEVALVALLSAGNAASGRERASDRDHLVEFARYVVATWPDVEQGDTARIALGEVALERGEFAEAVASFDSVRPGSPRKADAQSASGSAHWRRSLALRESGETAPAEAEIKAAIDGLKASLKTRKDANAAEGDPGLVATAAELATVQVAADKANDAVALLEPIVKVAGPPGPNNPTGSRAVTALLRAHVAAGRVDEAMVDMRTLEGSGGGSASNSAQLYFELGRLLERETEALRKRNDASRLARTEQAYRKFLKALVANKTGQTFQSLRWAADNLLKLGSAPEAAQVYADLLAYQAKDPEFLKTPNAASFVLATRVKQVAALRQSGQLNQAESNLNEIVAENRRLLEPQVEKGYILDAKAEAKVGTWGESYTYWKGLAGKLAAMNPKPVDYYEAWLHAARALHNQGKDDLARQAVASVMRLSPAVGTPEMKSQYQALLKQLTK